MKDNIVLIIPPLPVNKNNYITIKLTCLYICA